MSNSNGKCTVEWNWADISIFMAGLINGRNISSKAIETWSHFSGVLVQLVTQKIWPDQDFQN